MGPAIHLHLPGDQLQASITATSQSQASTIQPQCSVGILELRSHVSANHVLQNGQKDQVPVGSFGWVEQVQLDCKLYLFLLILGILILIDDESLIIKCFLFRTQGVNQGASIQLGVKDEVNPRLFFRTLGCACGKEPLIHICRASSNAMVWAANILSLVIHNWYNMT